MTTRLRWPMLSPPIQILIQLLLYKTITCLMRPATTFFVKKNKTTTKKTTKIEKLFKSLTIFVKKLYHRLLVGLNTALGNRILSKRYSFKRYFPCYIKLSVSLYLSSIFYFVAQIRKMCYRKKWKIEPLKSIY